MDSYIYLQSLLGYGATNTAAVLSAVGNINDIFVFDDNKLRNIGLTPAQIKRKASAKRDSAKVAEQCRHAGITVITYADERYPENLRNIFAPPVVLYVMGDVPRFNSQPAITVVGSRKADDYGKQASFSLAARLSLAGALIVSGDAVGGDSFAHYGALAVGGKPVAVTGGGLLSNYLLSSSELRRKIIAHGGALVSEFQPSFMPHGKGSFHIRNRIMAGISNVTAVTSAGSASGTLITAHLAAEFGRTVYAIPGRPNDESAVGTNALIKEGALPLISPQDLLADYTVDYPEINIGNINSVSAKELKREYVLCQGIPTKRTVERKETKPNVKNRLITNIKKTEKPKTKQNTPPKGLSEEMLAVYSALDVDGVTADDLVAATGLSPNSVLSALTRLEIMGLIKTIYGSKYALK